MSGQVLVVTGAGGMGEAIARRLGSGRTVVLGDVSEQALDRVATSLRADGFEVIATHLDVASRASVRGLAETAARAGDVTHIAHTAGLSPLGADTQAILRVDLYGVALVLEEFAAVVANGGAGVVVASMSGRMVSLPAEVEDAVIRAKADELLQLPSFQASALPNPGIAYALAKRANALLVMGASASWGARRARINALSPGVISTALGKQELAGPAGDRMRTLVAASAMHRFGTPSDIAEAAAFLLGPNASFITGTELLVDGGAVAAMRSGPRVSASASTQRA